MTWADFDQDSALERAVLEKSLPLAATKGNGKSSAVIDMAIATTAIFLSATDHLGASPAGCVDLLGIRPLLVGTAWRVMDLLIEEALAQAGEKPKGSKWAITGKGSKAQHALSRIGRPANLPSHAWDAFTETYVKTVDLRHSLVHRKAFTDSGGALIGVDDAGNRIDPVSPGEQEALGRTALRAAQAVTANKPDDRVAADLTRQLGYLTTIHGIALPAVAFTESLPQVTFIIDADPAAAGRYSLDVPAARARAQRTFPETTYADMVLQFRDRIGLELRGRLETAPDAVVSIDPDSPPSWLA
jgi:hypothetical protein